MIAAIVAGTSLAGCGKVRLPDLPDGAPPVPPTLIATRDRVNSVDLLFVVDNSPSMADKQLVLTDAVPQLVKRLVDPGCVGTDGTYDSDWNGNACPAGTTRDFDPVNDIHIGIITSSIGAHGASVCLATETGHFNDDRAHLLTRGATQPPASGFLAWNGTVGTSEALITSFQSMVAGVGETGCRYGAPLEAAYRFLNDPDPYDTITLDANKVAVLDGTDQVLLTERAAFLRPDSIVAVISITGEDDCSIWDGGQNWVVLEPPVGGFSQLRRGTVHCAANPNDQCCQSCSQPQKLGCPDIANDANCQKGFLTEAEDPPNLRCFDQKRRYGYDFLYPVQRYIDGLTGKQVPNRAGTALVDNPLFKDLSTACTTNGSCKAARDPSLVFFAGIVGVPWQDIAKDPANLASGFMTGPTIDWPRIIGDRANNLPPGDPLMIQSVAPRAGLAPPNSGPDSNPINGHEWDPSQDATPNADLQYACVFTLPTSRVCTPDNAACDCNGAPETRFNPLCQNASGQYSTTQVRAKAYPGTRHLEVLQGMGDQGIVASICPANLNQANKSAADYGYNHAVDALIDRRRTKLRGRCLPRPLEIAPDGTVPCVVLEGFRPGANQACNCEGDAGHPGRVTASNDVITPEMQSRFSCICEIVQLSGAQLTSCQSEVSMDMSSNGWCYVDPAQSTSTDISAECAIVKNCDATHKQIIRFSPRAEPRPGSTTFYLCRENAYPASSAAPTARTCPTP
jgi:hypothetical protein